MRPTDGLMANFQVLFTFFVRYCSFCFIGVSCLQEFQLGILIQQHVGDVHKHFEYSVLSKTKSAEIIGV